MKLNEDARADVAVRLRRVRGQIGGLVQMIEDGADCEDVVTQLAAASRALDRAGLKIISNGLQQCIAESESSDGGADVARLEKLFLALA